LSQPDLFGKAYSFPSFVGKINSGIIKEGGECKKNVSCSIMFRFSITKSKDLTIKIIKNQEL